MILPKKAGNSQQQNLLPRSERRTEIIRLEKKWRKLLRKLRRVNLDVVFDNDTTTAFGNFASIEIFKESIGL